MVLSWSPKHTRIRKNRFTVWPHDDSKFRFVTYKWGKSNLPINWTWLPVTSKDLEGKKKRQSKMNSSVYIIRFDSWALTALEFVCTLEQVNYDRFINGCGVNVKDRWSGLSWMRSATDRLLSVVTPLFLTMTPCPLCTCINVWFSISSSISLYYEENI